MKEIKNRAYLATKGKLTLSVAVVFIAIWTLLFVNRHIGLGTYLCTLNFNLALLALRRALDTRF